MATLCYSVRIKSLRDISAKAVVIETFDGRSDVFPKSAIFGNDMDVQKSEALWIAAWILPKKDIQWSSKKSIKFTDDGRMIPNVVIDEHVPEHVDPVINELEELLR